MDPFALGAYRVVVLSLVESSTVAGTPQVRVRVEVWKGRKQVAVDGDLIFVDPLARWSDEGWLRDQIGVTVGGQL